MDGKFWNLKAHPQWYASSNKATPLNPSQTVPLTGDQAFKYKSIWTPFPFNLHKNVWMFSMPVCLITPEIRRRYHSFWTGVMVLSLLCGCWEPNPSLLQEQVLFPTEPSFQPIHPEYWFVFFFRHTECKENLRTCVKLCAESLWQGYG